MSGIKNKDGSVNWSKVKVNQPSNAIWGVRVNTTPVTLDLTYACEKLVEEIERYAAKIRADQCCFCLREDEWHKLEGAIEACEYFIEFYENI